jgi:hypothetical protein
LKNSRKWWRIFLPVEQGISTGGGKKQGSGDDLPKLAEEHDKEKNGSPEKTN